MEGENNTGLVQQYAKQLFVDADNAVELLAQMIAVAQVNCGLRLSDEDFEYTVINMNRIIRNLYPEWFISDVAEAIFMGSIGKYGDIYRLSLATVNGWLQKHSGVISWRALENKMLQRDEHEKQRIERIDHTLHRLYPLYQKERQSGIKSWASLYLLQIPRIHKILERESPSLEELAYIIAEYSKRKEPVPPPDQFLTQIRSSGLITTHIAEKLNKFFDDLINDFNNEGQ